MAQQQPQSPPISPAQFNGSNTHIHTRGWRAWWQQLEPARQDRVAALAPLVAVALFLLAVASSFWYLRSQEQQQAQTALARDMDWTVERLRAQLLQRQEQLARIAREIGAGNMNAAMFKIQADWLIAQHPELVSLVWVNAKTKVIAHEYAAGVHLYSDDTPDAAADEASATPSNPPLPSPQDWPEQMRRAGAALDPHAGLHESLLWPLDTASLTRVAAWRTPIYAHLHNEHNETALAVHIPIMATGAGLAGTLIAHYSPDGLWRYGVPSEVQARYAISLLDAHGNVLAGVRTLPQSLTAQTTAPLKSSAARGVYVTPIAPVPELLHLRGVLHDAHTKLAGRSLFWLSVTLSVLTAWLMLGAWRHTRSRLKMQQALVAETNLRRAMEDATPTGIRALDLRGCITYVNPAFCQMTGFSREELIGQMPPYSFWPVSERTRLMQVLEHELRGQPSAQGVEVRLARKDGQQFEAQLQVAPLVDAHGLHTGWMSSFTDVSQAHRTREQLAHAHDRFTLVLEALDAAVSVAALGSTQLLFANRLYREWFGAQHNGHINLVEQAARSLSAPAPLDGQDGDEDDALMGLPTDSVTSASAHQGEIFVKALGRWLEVRTRYLSWVDGRLAQMVIATDITERRRAQEQAAQHAERVQTASRLITMGEMASSIAHELNQPLSAISNYCNGMRSRLDAGTLNDGQLRFALEKTAHQAQRAGQVIHRIRHFVKRSDPQRTRCKPQAIVEETMDLASIGARQRQVSLDCEIAPNLPDLYADAILLEQVLLNLIKNAAESIDAAGSTRRVVRVSASASASSDGHAGVEFAVTDTGPGLPAHVVDNLFEAFFTTKREGMGIGLNLCRSIVEAHGGTLRAQNLHDAQTAQCNGCRFTVWLPVATPAPDDDDEADAP